jgi:hypothetical protein
LHAATREPNYPADNGRPLDRRNLATTVPTNPTILEHSYDGAAPDVRAAP